jgi:hypothetical protein
MNVCMDDLVERFFRLGIRAILSFAGRYVEAWFHAGEIY